MDPEGYWYITGRKKELIVSSNGKKIYPARIEVLFKREPVISQVLLIGDRMPYVTALFTVNGSPEENRSAVEQAVKDVNKQLASFEQIRKFKILDRDFSIEQGEVTPTMKIRRSRVLENYPRGWSARCTWARKSTSGIRITQFALSRSLLRNSIAYFEAEEIDRSTIREVGSTDCGVLVKAVRRVRVMDGCQTMSGPKPLRVTKRLKGALPIL